MRLIDADAFTEFLKDTVKRQKYEDLKIDGSLTVADVIEAVISELDGTSLDGFKNAPTIEPDTDTISRQDVISTINAMRERCDSDDIDDYHDLLLESIEVLPSSQNQP